MRRMVDQRLPQRAQTPKKFTTGQLLLYLLVISIAAFLSPASAQLLLPVGPPDFRISDMGPEGSPGYDADTPDLAYNPHRNEVLVVWAAQDDALGVVLGQVEIYGQRVDASSGELLGSRVQISEGSRSRAGGEYPSGHPAIAYDAAHREYLVVWSAREVGFLALEREIFGRRLAGDDATPLGPQFQISSMNDGAGAGHFAAYLPAVTYSEAEDEFLVVWNGGFTGISISPTDDIHGQRVQGGSGATIGEATRLSGSNGANNAFYSIGAPSVAYCSAVKEYWVVFAGSHPSQTWATNEAEIVLQRVDAATGLEVGVDNQRISTHAGVGDPDFDALEPSIACLEESGVALVVWSGDSNLEGMQDGEFEIYGQLLDVVNGLEIEPEKRLSDMGGLGNPAYFAKQPTVVAVEERDLFFIAWRGTDRNRDLQRDEVEVFGQLISPTGRELGINDQRLTTVGAPLNAGEGPLQSPAVTTIDRVRQLIVFAEVQDYQLGAEQEVAGQFLEFPIFADGFESGLTAWSGPPRAKLLSSAEVRRYARTRS